uniref:Nucleotide-diphospho-sugar transferase domain-containing protein n=2 Tax=Oryza brachyantha TaxID=4533 RepID=J3M8U0_ORYBR
MVAAAQAADSDICVLADAETVLLPETVTLLKHLSRSDLDWFIFSVSRNISTFPYHLADNGTQWLDEDDKEVSFKKLQEIQFDKWAADGSDRGLIVAWNNPGSPLIAGVMPSFLNGRGAHNRWLIHEALSSDTRLVFDASNLVLGLHPENFSERHGISTSRNASSPAGSWEYGINQHLATVYGSYCYELPRRNSPMLYKVVKQYEDYMLSKIEELNLTDSVINKEQTAHEEGGSLCKKENYYSVAVSLPHSLEMLLQLAADKNRSVVLAVAGASYRDMLMSWVCRLRRLRVTNFVICALDQETYEFSVLQGLPVFRDPLLSPKNVSFDDCHFGTQCFQQVTKVKSRIVLKILRLGYNVLLSDVDVYWFHNPVSFLHSLGPGTFAAQSDEFNETGPINLPRRLNSGFYYARSDGATIAAMEMIVQHAANSGLSEQPSFYDILCGRDGANRAGADRCLEPSTNLTVVFLSRDRFPNGAYRGLWEKRHVQSACRELGCVIIHNNWVRGRRKKLQRQMESGLWDYDPSSRLCLQNWSDAKRFSIQNDEPVSYDR